MGSIDRRIEDLERAFSETTEPGRKETFSHLKAVLDELAHLRQSCASGLRGGVPIETENIPRKLLGPGYTYRQLLQLAVSRSVVAGRIPTERAGEYLECMCEITRKDLDTAVEEDVRP